MKDPRHAAAQLRVLICDSDARFTRRAGDVLQAAGYEVLVAAGRSKAIGMILSAMPQVVVIPSNVAEEADAGDIMALVRHLSPRPAVIITMTMSRFALAQKAWRLGADDAVFKPLLDDEFLAAVATAANKVTGETRINHESATEI